MPRSFQSIAAGRRIYVTHCVRCHGRGGKGDGGGAGGGGQPADLTDEVWEHGESDGEIFAVVRDGTSVDMEGYGERVSETDLWNLVNYLRELRTKNEERRTERLNSQRRIRTKERRTANGASPASL